jgi:bacteriocin biosynthesis cyclodehydratase domain-containing protein
MVLRLDPRIPVVWRDPFSLQFGVEPARVVLRDVSSAQERMIAALTIGVSEAGLALVAQAAGATASDAMLLLGQLGPLLAPVVGLAPSPSIVLAGRGPTADRIVDSLTETGVTVRRSLDHECDLAIAVGHYVFDPELYGFWLRRDIPHLPVLFADGVATIGPLVEPGSGPCLYCVEFYRRDTDARWSTLASQLWGRRSSAETALVSREVSALVARLALNRLEGGPTPATGTATSLRLDARDGSIVRREWLPHPDCGCHSADGLLLSATATGTATATATATATVAVANNTPVGTKTPAPNRTRKVSAAQRGSGSAGAAPNGSRPHLPRRAEAADERA